MRSWPTGRSWVSAAEDAVKRLRHAPIDMQYFTADARPPADLCAALVAGSDLYVGIIGSRYGSPVRDDPERSYTELEFDTATELGKRRLVFMVDEAGGGDRTVSGLTDDPLADRQRRFRRRLLDSGITVNVVSTPAALETVLVQAVAQLMLIDAIDVRPTSPVAARPRVPRQLPPEAAAFTDRVRQFERLSGLLSRPDERRAFVGIVSGPAGVGKTSFAVHVAHRVRERFPDGELYVDLRGYSALPTLDPEEVLDGFVRALGAEPERVPSDIAGLVDLYRGLLDGRRTLVILDNALTAEQVRPLLPPPGSAVIVTSRGPLSALVVHDGAARMTLEPLEPVFAEALLRALADAGLGRGDRDQTRDASAVPGTLTYAADDEARTRESTRQAAEHTDDANPAGSRGGDAIDAAVAELARQCGYLPLALRIAAEQAAISGLSLAELVDELASERGRLDALTGVDDDPNSEVRTVFSWSYRNLPENLRRSFRLLALHPGTDIGTSAAAALFGAPVAATVRSLNTLVAFNVLERPARGRYRFHDLVRAYATERLEVDEPLEAWRTAFDRELDWYLRTADAADRLIAPLRRHVVLGPPLADIPPATLAGYPEAVRWCDAEHRNVIALIRQAAVGGRPEYAWKLALASVTYYTLRHHHVDWLSVMEVAVQAARATSDQLAEAWCMTSLGGAAMALGHLDRAYAAHTASLRLHREISDRIGEGLALHNLGEAAQELGRLDEAVDLGQQALAIWRELGDPRSVALALRDTIAPVHFRRGELEQALHVYQEALDACHGIDRQVEGLVLHDLGRTNDALGRYAAASDDYDRALRVRRTSGDRMGEAETLRMLANTRSTLSDTVGAQSSLLQALAILVELGREAEADEVRARLREVGLDPGEA